MAGGELKQRKKIGDQGRSLSFSYGSFNYGRECITEKAIFENSFEGNDRMNSREVEE